MSAELWPLCSCMDKTDINFSWNTVAKIYIYIEMRNFLCSVIEWTICTELVEEWIKCVIAVRINVEYCENLWPIWTDICRKQSFSPIKFLLGL